MNKNMFKRAFLSFYRKPSKSMILMLIMFVMANLVLASMVIKNGVDEQVQYAKETLGSDVYLSADMSSIMQGMQGGQMGETTTDMDSSERVPISRPELNIEMVLDISNSSYVRDLYYTASGSANAYDIEVYEDDSSTESSMGGGMMRPDMSSNMNRGDFTITGLNTMAYNESITGNIFSLEDGVYVDESNDGVNISYELADLNGLSVGDYITLENIYTEELIEYEIVGIFIASTSGYENAMYMNMDSYSLLLSETGYNDGDYTLSSVVYYLNSPDYFEAFTEEVNSVYDLEALSLTLDIDSDAYDQMAGPIEQVGSFADTILIAVVIASVFIISLMINNNIKDRKYEMGVLMSLGAPKLNIICQIFVELVVVTTIGFVFSIGTSYFLANSLSDSILENQLTIESESTDMFERPGMSSGRPDMNTGGIGSTSSVDVIDEIEISVSVTDYALLFIIGYFVALISMLIPSMNIVKYEPKTILTGRE